ncbi:Uncharacterised protein [BD1-7 clade bacterium]|uniref:Endo-polygalacturonase n=1 Tax=BD1-7 clade bacterium TaxID=2029982 RepID=A0A5S9NYH6_9GAMM|nr:Uncharacterised protein [BD1-7 clade bacterium]CAA0095779.1 Uncharacterised protein [BD1-7 clade bacterium]
MSFKKLLLASAISSVLIAGCSNDDNDGTPQTSGGGGGGGGQEECVLENNILSGTITCDATLKEGETYFLRGVVNIGKGQKQLNSAADVQAAKDNGVTLTIEKGVNILADQDGVLIVTRGSKINAVGTAAQPISFSSQKDDDFDGLGEWGGIVIQGFAPHNAAGSDNLCSKDGAICNVKGEGGDAVAFFGGTDAADNSGELKYVRMAEGGKVAGPGNEINGLTLQGVGYGTQLSYIQVHGNLDDGIEWFGGRANAKYVVLTNNDDDDIDFDEGYQGHIQHALIIKHQTKASPDGSNDPRGIEANSSDDESAKSTSAILSNVTIIGSDMTKDRPADGASCDTDGTPGCNEQPGMRLRGDVTVDLYNSVVANYGICVRIDNGQDDMTTVDFTNVVTGGCDSEHKYKANGIKNDGKNAVPAPTPVNFVESTSAITFDTALAATATEAMLSDDVTVSSLAGRTEFTFDVTDYEGAVDPDTNNADRNWWAGWTFPNTVVIDSDLQAQQP